MLLWETMLRSCGHQNRVRLPGDLRCTATKKSGLRCKGRVIRNGELCAFHDPAARAARAARAQQPRPQRKTQYHLDGIPSRLTTRKGITLALDRLYNDTRTGLISPESGQVLFTMLERLMDVHLETRRRQNGRLDRSRAAKLRRRLAKTYIAAELLVRGAHASGDQGRIRPALERPLVASAPAADRPEKAAEPRRAAVSLLGPAVASASS